RGHAGDPGGGRVRQPRRRVRDRARSALARAAPRRPDRCDPIGAAPAGRGGRVLSPPRRSSGGSKSSWAIYRRLFAYTHPYRMGFAAALAAMVVAAATEPMFPALMKPLLDQG